MKNLNMWLKLGLGFGLILLLTCILSGLTYRTMVQTADNARSIAAEYIPEIAQVTGLDRKMRLAALQVRSYDLSGDISYYNNAIQFLDGVKLAEQPLRDHVELYPHLVLLRAFIKDFTPVFQGYLTQIEATRTQREIVAKTNAQCGAKAQQADAACKQLAIFITELLDNAARVQDADEVIKRRQMLDLVTVVRLEIASARLRMTVASIEFDQKDLQEAVDILTKMNTDLEKLSSMINTQRGRETLDVVMEAVAIYRKDVMGLKSVWQKLADARTQRGVLYEQALALTEGINTAGMDATVQRSSESLNDASQGATQLLVWAAGTIVLGLLISLSLTRVIVGPLAQSVYFAQQVSAGHLDETLTVHSKDEIGHLADALRLMIGSLKEKIFEAKEQSEQAHLKGEEATAAMQTAREAQKAAENAKREGMLAAAGQLEGVVNIVSSASAQLSAQIAQSERGAVEQAARVSEAATAMNEMNSTVFEVAKSAGAASEVSAKTRDRAESGGSIVQQAVASIQQVQTDSIALKQDMGVLAEQAQAISHIMSVISDIADQTNLLALNAAIEAARAGDAGRGFAVVADEVRKLAEKTMSSTADVGNAIQSIQRSTEQSIQQVDRAVKNIETATDLVMQSGEALHEITSFVDNTADQVQAIATASEQQSATSEEINRSIAYVNTIASDTTRVMQEAAQAVSELANQSQVLAGLIDDMKRG